MSVCCHSLLWLLSVAPVTSTAALPDEARTLLARFSEIPGLRAEFREEKHMQILRKPIRSHGVVYFQPPSRVARQTIGPVASSVVIDNSELTMSTGDTTQRLDLAANPEAGAFVKGFLAVLEGDIDAILKTYVVEFTGHSTNKTWQLNLVPKDEKTRKILASILLEGNGLIVSRMEIRERGGDWTRMTFHNVNVEFHFTAEDSKKIFAIQER